MHGAELHGTILHYEELICGDGDYRMSEPPKDLRVLLEIDRNNNEPYLAGGERSLDDPWGSPYRLECEGKRWFVVSSGPDGVPDTVDDISFERTAK